MTGAQRVLSDRSTAGRYSSLGLDGGTVISSPAIDTAGQTLSSDLKESTLLGSAAAPPPTLLDSLPSTGFTEVTPDQVMMAVLADSLIAATGVPANREILLSVIGTIEVAKNLVVGFGGLPGRQSPESPRSPEGLTDMLRLATEYTASGMPTSAEAKQLADFAIKGVTGLLGMTPAQFVALSNSLVCKTDQPQAQPEDPDAALLNAIWDKPDADDSAHPVWEDTSPADSSDPVQKSLATPAQLQQAAAAPIPPLVMRLLGLLDVVRLERLLRFSMPYGLRKTLRTYEQSKASLPGETAIDGKLVETALRNLYEANVSQGQNTVLYGTRIGLGANTLGDLSGTDPLWGGISTGLLSFFAGRPGQPDILDTTLGHVYEIKPMRRAVDAGQQLCRYLFRLNFYELAIANPGFTPLQIAAWAARAAGGNTDPTFFLKGRPFTSPKRFWAPGPWIPPPTIPFADGQSTRIATIEVPAPGIICYTTSRGKTEPDRVPDPAQSPDTNALLRLLVAMLIAWAGFEAGRRTKGLTEADYARFFELSVVFSGGGSHVDPEYEALVGTIKLLLLVAGVGAVVLSAPEALAGLGGGGVLETYLGGGSPAVMSLAGVQ
jgi:hypothetical protein